MSRLALLASLALLALPILAHPAAAPSAVPPSVQLDFEEELEEGFETEAEGDECAEAEGEFEAGELSEGEVTEVCEEAAEEETRPATTAASPPPQECPLRSARARVVALVPRSSIRLTLGYTTHEPANATIELRKGAARIGSSQRRLGRSGVIRLSERFGESAMARVQAARRLTVKLRIDGAAGDCRRFETQQLSVEHRSRSRTVWATKP